MSTPSDSSNSFSMVPVALDLGDDPIARLEENIGAVA